MVGNEPPRVPGLGGRETGRRRCPAQGRTICLRILYLGLRYRMRLEACVARQTKQDDFPPKDAARLYTHDLPKLLDSAGLGMAFEQETGQDRIFKQNWSVVRDWTEETRYQSRGQRQAEEILAAIKDPQHGVLQWLRRNW